MIIKIYLDERSGLHGDARELLLEEGVQMVVKGVLVLVPELLIVNRPGKGSHEPILQRRARSLDHAIRHGVHLVEIGDIVAIRERSPANRNKGAKEGRNGPGGNPGLQLGSHFNSVRNTQKCHEKESKNLVL